MLNEVCYFSLLFSCLSHEQADLILKKLDPEGLGRVSAKSFKNWLLQINNTEDKVILANLLYKLIKEKYNGDPRNLFDQCKRCVTISSLHQRYNY